MNLKNGKQNKTNMIVSDSFCIVKKGIQNMIIGSMYLHILLKARDLDTD